MLPQFSPPAEELTGPNPPQDYCSWEFECLYEEQIEKTAVPKRWFSKPAGSTLFYITRYAYNEDEYKDLNSFKLMKSTKDLTKVVVNYPEAVDSDLLLTVCGTGAEMVKLQVLCQITSQQEPRQR